MSENDISGNGLKEETIEKDFAIPAYQRNKVPLYDLRTVPQDRWIELALYED